MQRFFALVFLATAGWLTYNRYLRHPVDESPVGYSIVEHRRSIVPGRSAPTAEPESFTCDGRRYCSEMHSSTAPAPRWTATEMESPASDSGAEIEYAPGDRTARAMKSRAGPPDDDMAGWAGEQAAERSFDPEPVTP